MYTPPYQSSSKLSHHVSHFSLCAQPAQLPACHSDRPMMPCAGCVALTMGQTATHLVEHRSHTALAFFLKVVFLLPFLMSESLYLCIKCNWICVWDLFDGLEQLTQFCIMSPIFLLKPSHYGLLCHIKHIFSFFMLMM